MTFPSPAADQSSNWEVFVYPIVSVFAILLVLYVISQACLKRDNSFIDILWGVTFCLPIAIVWIVRIKQQKNQESSEQLKEENSQVYLPTYRMILAAALVYIWGIRLIIYLAIRKSGEDYRYVQLREGWEAEGTCSYYTKTFIFIYLL